MPSFNGLTVRENNEATFSEKYPGQIGYHTISEAFTKVLIDESGSITYVGEAPPGTATSSAAWRVQKIDTSSGVSVTWADGDERFNNIWDNRASLSYS